VGATLVPGAWEAILSGVISLALIGIILVGVWWLITLFMNWLSDRRERKLL